MSSVFESAGAGAVGLVLPESDWVHRRVKSVSFPHTELRQIRLSVDFTVPSRFEGDWVPITVLPKWPPLFRIDLRDAAGEPIPLLTSRQNGDADLGLMRALAKAVDPSMWSCRRFANAIENLTRGPDTHLEEHFAIVRDEVLARFESASGDDRALADRLVDLAYALTESTLLWVPTERFRGGKRHVVKIAYTREVSDLISPLKRALRSMGWAYPPEVMYLRHAGADTNFHVEIEAPSPLVVRDLKSYFLRSTSHKRLRASEADAPAIDPDLKVYEALAGQLGHMYVSGRRPMTYMLLATIAPARNAFITAAALASLLIAVALTLGYFGIEELANNANREGAIALLALVPALIAYVIARPSDPPMVRRYHLGVQVLLGISAAVPVTLAGMVLVFGGDVCTLEYIWIAGTVLSWAATLALGFSEFQTRR